MVSNHFRRDFLPHACGYHGITDPRNKNYTQNCNHTHESFEPIFSDSFLGVCAKLIPFFIREKKKQTNKIDNKLLKWQIEKCLATTIANALWNRTFVAAVGVVATVKITSSGSRNDTLPALLNLILFIFFHICSVALCMLATYMYGCCIDKCVCVCMCMCIRL